MGQLGLVIIHCLFEAAESRDDDGGVAGSKRADDAARSGVTDDRVGALDVVQKLREGHIRGRVGDPTRRIVWSMLNDQLCGGQVLERGRQSGERPGATADCDEDHSTLPA